MSELRVWRKSTAIAAGCAADAPSVGELEDAEKEFRDAPELSPELPNIDIEIAKSFVLRRRFDEASSMIEQMPASTTRDQVVTLALYGSGKRDAADEAFARLKAAAAHPDATPQVKIEVAEVEAFRGNGEEALDVIESALGPVSTRLAAAPAIYASQKVHRSPFFISLRTHALASAAARSGEFRQGCRG